MLKVGLALFGGLIGAVAGLAGGPPLAIAFGLAGAGLGYTAGVIAGWVIKLVFGAALAIGLLIGAYLGGYLHEIGGVGQQIDGWIGRTPPAATK